ncbi:hypothetical protein [Actinomadura sp. NTSP31]|uniref:hypothetical protein n=1 Tax=Actinomadura sp. NTSP31 TaxID=1735447 RepID=UPI0035C02067
MGVALIAVHVRESAAVGERECMTSTAAWREGRGRLYPGVAGVVTLGICMRDESVSVVVGHSGVGGIREFTDRIDAVHMLYCLVTELGTSEVVTRAPSAVAVAGVAVLGKRLYSARAGLYGGLLYGMLPITSRYGPRGGHPRLALYTRHR